MKEHLKPYREINDEILFGSKMDSSHIYIIGWKILKIDLVISLRMLYRCFCHGRDMKDPPI